MNAVKKIWNKNFFLLWQGQLVSVFGDALYSIALDFFVLEVTGSTAIMGTVMALITIPRILIGPLAGVIVDRSNRKNLIILGDVIRGLSILLITWAARCQILEIWMIMAVAILSGICSSFFNPAIESVLPNLVPSDSLIKATSFYQIATTGADVLGQSIGGALYSLLGAPILFFINGISYLFSAATEGFIDVPKIQRKNINLTFRQDLKDGIQFVYKYKGILRTIIMSFFFNFLFGMIRVLIIPWFVGDSSLGMARYGILNAAESIGLVSGMIILSFITIKAVHRYQVYITSLLLFVGCIGMGAFLNQYVFILLFFFLAFGFQFAFNTIMNSTIMQKTPSSMRGKVSATKTALGLTASPIGNFVGGVIGEFFEARLLIIISTVIAAIIIVVVVFHPSVQFFLNDENEITAQG